MTKNGGQVTTAADIKTCDNPRLTSDKNHLKAVHHTHELIFGYGSTKCLGMPMAMMGLNKVIFEVRMTF